MIDLTVDQVLTWQTSDGELFMNEQEAIKHQVNVSFDKYVDDNDVAPYMCNHGHVPASELREWIIENRELVERLLESC